MKTLLSIAISFALAGVATASTITESCGAPVVFTGSPLTGSHGPASFTCAALGIGAGSTITGIQLFYLASYNFGSTPGTDTVVWTFNPNSGTWSGGNTETVSGSFSSSTNTPTESAGVLDSPFGPFAVGAGQIDTTDLGVGTNAFTGVSVSAPVTVTGGVSDTTGDLFAQLTYSSPVVASPEPATASMMLIALAGLGLATRRRR